MISGAHTAPFARTVANSTIITPNSRKFQVATQVDVPGDRQRRAVRAHEQASTVRSASVSSTISAPVISSDWTMPTRVIWPDPVPLPGADILRGHRADRRAERHRRHLDIGPQLHRDAEGRGGVDAFAVDQPDQRQRGHRDDDHLDAHRQALDDDRLQDRGIGQQIAKLAPAQPQRQVLGVDVDEKAEQAA